MERLVSILVPKWWMDGIARLAAAEAVITCWAIAGHFIVFGRLHGAVWQHIVLIQLVAIPPVFLFMWLLAQMNVLRTQLAELATTDPLTGLANRRAFFQRAAAENRRRGGVMLMIDVDHFKDVNDTYGHDTGDRCLVEIARLLRSETRETDVVGRIGGEEFAVFLVDAQLDKAVKIGERLTEAVQFRAARHDDDIRVTSSVGAAVAGGATGLEDLISRADRMMYEAKKAGRARLLVWAAGRVESRRGPTAAA